MEGDPEESKQARHSRKIHAAKAAVGELPPIADPARRESCRLDLHLFLRSYFPRTTGRSPFGEDQIRAIKRIELAALPGGGAYYIQAFPRGYAKTSISEGAAVWAALYGHRKFPLLYGATKARSEEIIDAIKQELSENDLLLADFPEVCYPIQKLDGVVQRTKSQTYRGEKTSIQWTAQMIVLPTIPGSAASGTAIATRSMSGSGRGAKHKRKDGTSQRPDFIILDDPQTDKGARSPNQVATLERTISKNIMMLGDHESQLSIIANVTCIEPDDLVDRMMDRTKYPSWQSERIAMVKAWPAAHESFWLTKYATVRNTFDKDDPADQARAWKDATALYLSNREEADAGGIVSWEACYKKDGSEISAIQHAYNALIDRGEEAFQSEYQNKPIKRTTEGSIELEPAAIRAKANGVPRLAILTQCDRITAFIDVHKDALYYAAACTGDSFTGHIPDYGTFPEQNQRYFSLKDVKKTLADAFPGQQFEEMIYSGLNALTTMLFERHWKRQDGTVLSLERCMIDANWGDSTEIVRQFCRQSKYRAMLFPSHGRYVSASSPRLADKKKVDGERVGHDWRVGPIKNQNHAVWDTNSWKTFLMKRFAPAAGAVSGLTLFGSPNDHDMYADHICSEYAVEVTAEKNKHTVNEWHLKVGQDNHLLDCTVGALVAASIQGCTLQGMARGPVKRKKVALSQIQGRVYE